MRTDAAFVLSLAVLAGCPGSDTGTPDSTSRDGAATDTGSPMDAPVGRDVPAAPDAGADVASDTGGGGGDGGGGGLLFPAGTICNDTGAPRAGSPNVRHVIVLVMENKSYSAVHGSSNAPYFNSLTRRCGYSTQFIDNLFTSDIVSEPHYLAMTSGSNCNTGLGSATQTPGSTGCITDDADATAHRLTTVSIFNQVGSYRSYQESMPSACAATSSSPYATKHNPPPFYTMAPACAANDLPIPAVTCPTTVNTPCSRPDNAFTQDLANDTLADYVFVTPNLVNDMHDGTVAQGDNWLHTYVPLILASRAYLRGEVAIHVLWDEAGSNSAPQPNLFISPYIRPTASSTAMNLFAALRAAESQLGITTYLGCAGGHPPGGIGTCPAGSTTDLRAVFGF